MGGVISGKEVVIFPEREKGKGILLGEPMGLLNGGTYGVGSQGRAMPWVFLRDIMASD